MRHIKHWEEEKLKITVPKRINFIFLFAQIVISAVFIGGAIFVIGNYLSSEPADLFSYVLHYLHMLLWIVTSTFCSVIVMWAVFGKETLFISEHKILYGDLLFGFGKSHEINKWEVTTFIFQKAENEFLNGHLYLGMPGIDEGKVLFSSRHQNFSFGTGMSDAEAKELVIYLNQYLKSSQ